MGGWGSTRWGFSSRRATVEDALCFSLKPVRQHLLVESALSMEFEWGRAGLPSASVAVTLGPLRDTRSIGWDQQEAQTERFERLLTLRFALVSDGVSESVEQHTSLVALAMRFGGVRWWLQCPRCHHHREALYLPRHAGGRRWLCRCCYGLRHRTQRVGPAGRAEIKMQRIAMRINGGWFENWLDFSPPKPLWMRRTTYERHVRAWNPASAARDRVYAVQLGRILARHKRYG